MQTSGCPWPFADRAGREGDALEEQLLEPVGCRYSCSCCGGEVVFVDEAAEQVAAPHPEVVEVRVVSDG